MTKAEGCIFVDTFSGCAFKPEGKCIAPRAHKLECLFGHPHTVVDPDACAELHRLLDEDIHRPSRDKAVSGEVGRSLNLEGDWRWK